MSVLYYGFFAVVCVSITLRLAYHLFVEIPHDREVIHHRDRRAR